MSSAKSQLDLDQARRLGQIRDAILALNMISEISEKSRTEEQKQIAEKASAFLYEEMPDHIEILVEPAFAQIMFLEDEPWSRWENVIASADCRPPEIPVNITLNESAFESYFRKIYTGYNTVSGCYEEAVEYLSLFDEWMDVAELRAKALWGFEKPTKAGALFSAIVPQDVASRIARVRAYKERLRKRIDQYEMAVTLITQLKLVNLGTPNSPRHVYSQEEPKPEPTVGFRRGARTRAH